MRAAPTVTTTNGTDDVVNLQQSDKYTVLAVSVQCYSMEVKLAIE